MHARVRCAIAFLMIVAAVTLAAQGSTGCRVGSVMLPIPILTTVILSALQRDPSSYRAAPGIASMFLIERDSDSAPRAFDAAPSRSHDTDEQKFLTIAIGDLATITRR